MSDTPVSLEFLAQQLKQLLTDVSTLRDDMRVLTAVVMRVDHTQAAMLDEIRAVHAQRAA